MIAVVFLALWFAIVAAFCGVGGWAAWAVGATALEAHRMQSWVAVPATVEQLELVATGDEESVEDQVVRARYRYEFDGVPREGTRLGISGEIIGDSFDGWHGKVHAKLAQARASGQPVTVWVNPARPWESVVDRKPRSVEFGFLAFMAILCGGIGVGWLRKLFRAHFAGSRRRLVAACRSTAGTFPRGATPGMEPGGDATGDLPEPPIPRSIASLEQAGDILTLRYSARRRLGSATWFAGAGGAFIYLGVAEGPPYRRVAGALILGALLVLVAVARLAGRLVVTVRPGEIRVDQSSLLGRKVWRARREDIRAIRPEVSFRMNYVSHYALFADTGRQRLLLGNWIVGADVANSLARRIARALGAPPSIVARVGADPGRNPSR
jgi:hypothetical protein